MSGYIGATPLTSAVQKRKSFSATSGQTIESFSYQPGYLDVFLNGVKLRDTEDYVATNGTSITFNTALTLGGEVDLVSLSNFTPHDSYFKAESDAKYVTLGTPLGGPSVGTGAIIRTNANVINENITITTPVTLGTAYTITIETGATWSII